LSERRVVRLKIFEDIRLWLTSDWMFDFCQDTTWHGYELVRLRRPNSIK